MARFTAFTQTRLVDLLIDFRALRFALVLCLAATPILAAGRPKTAAPAQPPATHSPNKARTTDTKVADINCFDVQGFIHDIASKYGEAGKPTSKLQAFRSELSTAISGVGVIAHEGQEIGIDEKHEKGEDSEKALATVFPLGPNRFPDAFAEWAKVSAILAAYQQCPSPSPLSAAISSLFCGNASELRTLFPKGMHFDAWAPEFLAFSKNPALRDKAWANALQKEFQTSRENYAHSSLDGELELWDAVLAELADQKAGKESNPSIEHLLADGNLGLFAELMIGSDKLRVYRNTLVAGQIPIVRSKKAKATDLKSALRLRLGEKKAREDWEKLLESVIDNSVESQLPKIDSVLGMIRGGGVGEDGRSYLLDALRHLSTGPIELPDSIPVKEARIRLERVRGLLGMLLGAFSDPRAGKAGPQEKMRRRAMASQNRWEPISTVGIFARLEKEQSAPRAVGESKATPNACEKDAKPDYVHTISALEAQARQALPTVTEQAKLGNKPSDPLRALKKELGTGVTGKGGETVEQDPLPPENAVALEKNLSPLMKRLVREFAKRLHDDKLSLELRKDLTRQNMKDTWVEELESRGNTDDAVAQLLLSNLKSDSPSNNWFWKELSGALPKGTKLDPEADREKAIDQLRKLLGKKGNTKDENLSLHLATKALEAWQRDPAVIFRPSTGENGEELTSTGLTEHLTEITRLETLNKELKKLEEGDHARPEVKRTLSEIQKEIKLPLRAQLAVRSFLLQHGNGADILQALKKVMAKEKYEELLVGFNEENIASHVYGALEGYLPEFSHALTGPALKRKTLRELVEQVKNGSFQPQSLAYVSAENLRELAPGCFIGPYSVESSKTQEEAAAREQLRIDCIGLALHREAAKQLLIEGKRPDAAKLLKRVYGNVGYRARALSELELEAHQTQKEFLSGEMTTLSPRAEDEQKANADFANRRAKIIQTFADDQGLNSASDKQYHDLAKFGRELSEGALHSALNLQSAVKEGQGHITQAENRLRRAQQSLYQEKDDKDGFLNLDAVLTEPKFVKPHAGVEKEIWEIVESHFKPNEKEKVIERFKQLKTKAYAAWNAPCGEGVRSDAMIQRTQPHNACEVLSKDLADFHSWAGAVSGKKLDADKMKAWEDSYREWNNAKNEARGQTANNVRMQVFSRLRGSEWSQVNPMERAFSMLLLSRDEKDSALRGEITDAINNISNTGTLNGPKSGETPESIQKKLRDLARKLVVRTTPEAKALPPRTGLHDRAQKLIARCEKAPTPAQCPEFFQRRDPSTPTDVAETMAKNEKKAFEEFKKVVEHAGSDIDRTANLNSTHESSFDELQLTVHAAKLGELLLQAAERKTTGDNAEALAQRVGIDGEIGKAKVATHREKLEQGRALASTLARVENWDLGKLKTNPDSAIQAWAKKTDALGMGMYRDWLAEMQNAHIGFKMTEKEAREFLGKAILEACQEQSVASQKRKEIEHRLAPIVKSDGALIHTGYDIDGVGSWKWKDAKLHELKNENSATVAASDKAANDARVSYDELKRLLDEHQENSVPRMLRLNPRFQKRASSVELEERVQKSIRGSDARFAMVDGGDGKTLATMLTGGSEPKIAFSRVTDEMRKDAGTRAAEANRLVAPNGKLWNMVQRYGDFANGFERYGLNFEQMPFLPLGKRAPQDIPLAKDIEATEKIIRASINELQQLGEALVQFPNPDYDNTDPNSKATVEIPAHEAAKNLQAQLGRAIGIEKTIATAMEEGYSQAGDVIKTIGAFVATEAILAYATAQTGGAAAPATLPAGSAAAAAAKARITSQVWWKYKKIAELTKQAMTAKNSASLLNTTRKIQALSRTIGSGWARTGVNIAVAEARAAKGMFTIFGGMQGVTFATDYFAPMNAKARLHETKQKGSIDKDDNGVEDWREHKLAGIAYHFPPDIQKKVDSDDNGIPDYYDVYPDDGTAPRLFVDFANGGVSPIAGGLLGTAGIASRLPLATKATRPALNWGTTMLRQAAQRLPVLNRFLPYSDRVMVPLTHRLASFGYTADGVLGMYSIQAADALLLEPAQVIPGMESTSTKIGLRPDFKKFNKAWNTGTVARSLAEAASNALPMLPMDDHLGVGAQRMTGSMTGSGAKAPTAMAAGLAMRVIVNVALDCIQAGWQSDLGNYSSVSGKEMEDWKKACWDNAFTGFGGTLMASAPHSMLNAQEQLAISHVKERVYMNGGRVSTDDLDIPRVQFSLTNLAGQAMGLRKAPTPEEMANQQTIRHSLLDNPWGLDFEPGKRERDAFLSVFGPELAKTENGEIPESKWSELYDEIDASTGRGERYFTTNQSVIEQMRYRYAISEMKEGRKVSLTDEEGNATPLTPHEIADHRLQSGEKSNFHHTLKGKDLISNPSEGYNNEDMGEFVKEVATDFGLDQEDFKKFVLDEMKRDAAGNAKISLQTFARQYLEMYYLSQGRRKR